MTAKEIKLQHKILHDTISADYYNHLRHPDIYPIEIMTKDEFDILHAQNWDALHTRLLAEGYIKPPEPSEIDKIKTRLTTLESQTNLVHLP
tara:strand:+ start:530 stop:802 length:273 start_codon:yes stop_codon:yes gene_type:complete